MAFRTVTRSFTALATALFAVTLSLTAAVVATSAEAAGPNSPPQAVDDVLFTAIDTSDTAVSIDVLANDTDPDGDPLTIDTAPYPVGTSNGIVDIDVATGRLLYTANNGFVGPATFTYDVTDGTATSTAIVRVFVGFHSNIIPDIAFDAPGQISRSAVLGVPTTYSIHAANASSFPAHDVTITNSVPSNFEITSVSNTTDCRITGNDITCHWNVLDPFDPAIDNSVGTSVELMPVATGVFTNSMTVTSLEDDPAQPLPSFDYASSVYQSSSTADLGALANGLPTTSNLGDHVVMSFNGQNYGPSAASNVVLTDTIPPNFRIDSISNPTDCAAAGNTVTCQRATLTGFFETAVFLTAVAPGSWSNSATITSATPEAAPEYAANTSSMSGTVAGLAFTSADHATFTAGAAGTFTVMVAGHGLPTVSATGPLPSGLTFVDNGDGTATLGGTPDIGSVGSYPLAITASNGIDPDLTQSFTATVQPGAGMLVTSITPSKRAVGLRNQTFDIRGGGFVTGARATVTGVPNANQRTMFVDSTHLTLTISRIPAGALIGPHDVTVTNPGTAGLRATCAGCLIFDPRPTLTSAAPAALPQRATANVVLTGTGFTTGAAVSFGSGVTINAPPSVGAGGTSLTVNVTIASNAGVGGRTVRVTNTDGGSVSRALFRVNAAPVIFGVTPNALARGVPRQVVINGANFATPSPAVSFGSGVNVLTVVRNSASKLTVSVTVNPNAAIGPRDLTVTNPDGGVATRTAAIRIL